MCGKSRHCIIIVNALKCNSSYTFYNVNATNGVSSVLAKERCFLEDQSMAVVLSIHIFLPPYLRKVIEFGSTTFPLFG